MRRAASAIFTYAFVLILLLAVLPAFGQENGYEGRNIVAVRLSEDVRSALHPADLKARLDALRVGSPLRMGYADFRVSGIIDKLPAPSGFALAPPVLVTMQVPITLPG